MRKVTTATPTRLRQLREAKGLKRHEVAVKLSVDPSTVQRWEQLGPPRWEMQRVAEFYGVTVAHMMGWDEAAA